MRWVLRITAGVVALIVLLVAGIGVYLFYSIHASFPKITGTLTVPGLSQPVQVLRDSSGIPQVYASTAADLFFAQGYVQAQDRFWEMDVRRHITAGRLAELFGSGQVQTDEFIRTMGWRRVAEQEYATAAPTTRAYLQDYAHGVNAWLASQAKGGGEVPVSLGSKASFEYRLLGIQNSSYKVEPWNPVDSVAWLKAMAWDLRANMTDELTRSLVSGLVGPARTLELYPPYPYAHNRTVVSQGTAVHGTFNQNATPTGRPVAASVAGPPPGATAALKATRALLIKMAGIAGHQVEGLGSNSWVVSGKLTNTGMPLLANDPHLEPSLPGIWYQMGLHCTTVNAACPFDMAGFTFSGLPGVVIGHNAHVGWGFTNLTADVSDLFIEKIVGNDYVENGKRHPLIVRHEVIKVAGSPSINYTIRATDHGPLISDASVDYRHAALVAPTVGRTPTASYGMSLQWTALYPGHTVDAIAMLDAARNWQDFRKAAASFDVPAQNLIYADTSGNIGYQTPGWLPLRKGWDGSWPAPGWDSRYGWAGRVPFSALPSVLNPKEGFVVTANQAVVAPQYPYFLGSDFDNGFRAQRIANLLNQYEAKGKITAADLRTIQLDTYNPNAAFLIPRMKRAGLLTGYDATTQKLVDQIANWDMYNKSTSAGALAFNVFWSELLKVSFDTQLPRDYQAWGDDRWYVVMQSLWNRPTDKWWDDLHTASIENRDDAVRLALRTAASYVDAKFGTDASTWQWGKLHQLELTNATFGSSGISLLEKLFNRGPYNVGGGPAMVDAIGWTASNGYSVDSLPSMRQVLDLSNWDNATWVQFTGESGHIYNSWYTDQAPLWVNGQTLAWKFSAQQVKANTKYTLTLQP